MKNKYKILLWAIRTNISVFVLVMIGLIAVQSMAPETETEIELSGIWGILLFIVLALIVIMFLAMFAVQLVKGIKTEGIKYVMNILVKLAIMFVVLFVLSKLLRNGESLQYYFNLAVIMTVVNTAMECWRDIKEKSKWTNK